MNQWVWVFRRYFDVFAYANSEYEYLLPLIATGELVTMDIAVNEMQRFHNMVTAAIKRTDPQALVTTGMHSMPYISDAKVIYGCISVAQSALAQAANTHLTIRLGWDSAYRLCLLHSAWQYAD